MSRFRNVNSMARNFRDKTPQSTEDSIFSFLFKDLRDELKKVGESISELDARVMQKCELKASLVQQVQKEIRHIRHDNVKTHLGLYILMVGWSILAIDNLIGWKEVLFAVMRKVKDEMPIKRKIKKD